MTDKSLLLVVPVLPWPARANGISIRYYPLLERLAGRCKCDLLVTASPDADPSRDGAPLSVRRVVVLPARADHHSIGERIKVAVDALKPTGVPYEYAEYGTGAIDAAVTLLAAEARYDVVHCVGHTNRVAVGRVRERLRGARLTYDCIDSPYLHYLRSRHPNVFARKSSLFRRFDLWKTRRWERALLQDVDASAYISSADATAAGPNAVSHVIANGIYEAAAHAPIQRNDSRPPTIGFLGNMAYRPNVIGALSLHADVFLPLKAHIPDLRLKIIGRDPVPEIVALASSDVEVTGTVDDIWPHIDSVDVFIFPMTTGAGLQNKILEVMHAGKPVITTPVCQASVGAARGMEIAVSATPAEMVVQAMALLGDPVAAEGLGRRGQAYVDDRFSLATTLGAFERMLFPQGSLPSA